VLDDTAEPLVRWEYVSGPPAAGELWCRYHLQGAIVLGISSAPELTLNTWHLPTGPVAIEEVVRFCIVDLGVTPLSDDWDHRLRESRENADARLVHVD
jgi:hypothetical protein